MKEKLEQTIASEQKNTLDMMARNRYTNMAHVEVLLRELERILVDNTIPSDTLMQELNQPASSEAVSFLSKILNPYGRSWMKDTLPLWPVNHPVAKAFITRKKLIEKSSLWYVVQQYITSCFEETTNEQELVALLHEQGWKDEEIVSAVCHSSHHPYYKQQQRRRSEEDTIEAPTISPFGKYLLPLLASRKGFLGLSKEEGLYAFVNDFYKDNYMAERRLNWVSYLADFYPEGLQDEVEYLRKTNYNGPYIDYNILYVLIEKNPSKYEQLALDVIDQHNPLPVVRYSLYVKLENAFPKKYDDKIKDIGENHFTYFQSIPEKGHYRYDPYTSEGPMLQAYTNYLWKQDAEAATVRVLKFIDDATFLVTDYLTFIEKKLGDQSVAPLLVTLFKESDYILSSPRDYYQHILNLLEKYDLQSSIDKLIEFGITLADKKSKIQLAAILARYPEIITPIGTSLLTGKTVDQRVLGALLLSNVITPAVKNSLDDAVDREINDDTRDIILESLQEQRFAIPYTEQQAKEMIDHADKRKKLSKWSEKFLIEENLPSIYWMSGKKLDEKDVRFLFYRMKRSKGMNSDVEAKQVINLLDSSRTSAFAKQLVSAFQESNADSKLKYYLTIGGLLGDDEMMHSLHMLFKKSIADKRAKMAEYVIGALAMVGSNRALRIVESIYRKFANKKPAISEAAQEALAAAATEQQITMEELGDRIIPTFDFDGLYKTVTVGEDVYRAFIGTDFKINFFNEDNKLRKSLPSTASKELKTEIKDIEKEINDVIKTQPGRLEKCMLDERRWTEEQWNTFFFNHPIMFVYTTKLLWGAFDADNKLSTIFYCTPNAELLDVNEEEIALDESLPIGIIHPIQLNEEQLNAWKDKTYNAGITTLFNILDRPVYSPVDEESDRNFSKRFFDRPVPKGADHVNTFLVKQNWRKSSGDGGRSEFTKIYSSDLHAYASIDGPAAYFQENKAPATVFEISFHGKRGGEKVTIKEVPPIFYSEVMSDIDLLLKA